MNKLFFIYYSYMIFENEINDLFFSKVIFFKQEI